MKVIFLEEAEQEFVEAALYYEKQSKGLGKKFTADIYQAIEMIVDFPLSSPKLTADIRRKLINRYPFAVLYRIDEATIVIIAVMNLRRKPFYWLNRI